MKKYVCLIIFAFTTLSSCLKAQSLEQQSFVPQPVELKKIPIPYESYPFIDTTYNKILIPSADTIRFVEFYNKIERLITLGDRQINILHIGGSHVQADMFSHKVRQNLDAINAQYQSPRGFIFPFKVANTNNPTNYRVSYSGEWNSVRNVQANREVSLGMGGIAVYTSDPEATILIELNPDYEDRRWTFDRLRLLGYPEDEDAPIHPVVYHLRDTIYSYYDLVTDSYVFNMPETCDYFEMGFISEVDSVDFTFMVNGFIPEKDVPGIIYHAIGVNGASTESYLGSEYFEQELSIIMPDLVIFGIGINDAAGKDFTPELFYANYTELLRRIREVSPDCTFLFLTNNDSYKRVSRGKYAVNNNGLLARDVFYRLAQDNQAGVWDLFMLMGGLKSMAEWEKAGLAQRDKIHFKREGYELLGDMLYNALLQLYFDIEQEE
jgi:hypothetical protein